MGDAWQVLADADRTGAYAVSLDLADVHLGELGVDGPAVERLGWMHVRGASLHLLRRHAEAVATSIEMVQAAPTWAWLSLALASRAMMSHFVALDAPLTTHPGYRVLDDLARASVLINAEPVADERRIVAAAHNLLGSGYWLLGLFELADPHYVDAHRLACESGEWALAARVLLNHTMMQIEYGDERNRIGQPDRAQILWAEADRRGQRAEELILQSGLGHLRRRAVLFRAAASARFGPAAPAIATLNELAEFDWVPSAHLAVLRVALSRAHLRLGNEVSALTQARAAVDLMKGVFGSPASIQAYEALAAALPPTPDVKDALTYAAAVASTRWRDRQQLLDAARVSLDYERVAQQQRRSDELSKTDPLTGLGNRRALEMQLKEWLDDPIVPRTVGLLLADVNGLKAINDRLGHPAGDRVLVSVARHLLDECGGQGLVVRWGGDEFLILLPGATLQRATDLALRVSQTIESSGTSVSVTVGVAAGSLSNLADVLAEADADMYRTRLVNRLPRR